MNFVTELNTPKLSSLYGWTSSIPSNYGNTVRACVVDYIICVLPASGSSSISKTFSNFPKHNRMRISYTILLIEM